MIQIEAMPNDNFRLRPEATSSLRPPRVGAAFRWDRETWGHALRCVPFEASAQHLFTSKQLRLPANGSDAQTREAWSAIAASMHATPAEVLRVKQVHGNVVRVVTRESLTGTTTAEKPDGDAIVSNAPGLVLAVVVADCVPILLADATGGAVAAIHAGWRGTCAGIAAVAVETMRRVFETRPENLVAAIGPSIGPEDYVVGPSLVDAFAAAGHGDLSLARWFSRAPSGDDLRLDLWRANQDQLERSGVRMASIFNAGVSTFAHPDWLESFRRDAASAGRMVAMVGVPAMG
jgi:YfiH family protein